MDDEIKKQSSKAETKNENQEVKPAAQARAKAFGRWQQLEAKVAEEALFGELREAAAALDDAAPEKGSANGSSRSSSVANAPSPGLQQEESKVSAQKQKQK